MANNRILESKDDKQRITKEKTLVRNRDIQENIDSGGHSDKVLASRSKINVGSYRTSSSDDTRELSLSLPSPLFAGKLMHVAIIRDASKLKITSKKEFCTILFGDQ